MYYIKKKKNEIMLQNDTLDNKARKNTHLQRREIVGFYFLFIHSK